MSLASDRSPHVFVIGRMNEAIRSTVRRTPMKDPFWSIEELDLGDSLNQEIWSDSPGEQEHIQPY